MIAEDRMGPQTGCQFFKEYTIGENSLQIYTTKILDSIVYALCSKLCENVNCFVSCNHCN